MRRVKLILSLLLVISLSVLLMSFSKQEESLKEEIARINKSIKENGLNWIAGKTSMNVLPLEERLKRLGSFIPNYINPDEFVKVEDKISILSFLDWRDYDSENWLTPIKDQGSCGSCWAFGTCAAVESIWKIEKSKPSSNPDSSEQHLVSCSTAGDCDGGMHSLAAKFFKNQGVPPESCFPYVASDVACDPCSDYLSKLTTITGYGWITQAGFLYSPEVEITSNQAIVNELSNGPVIGQMTVYSDFHSYTGGVYEVSPGATEQGGHCIAIIGYDDANDYWICKNSWGTDWGEAGYFKIRFDEADIGSWVLKVWGVSLANKPPTLDPIADQSTKEGVDFSLQLQATDPDDDELTYSGTSMPDGAELDESSGLFTWTPTYTQSGTYYVTFTVTDGIFSDSEIAEIKVANVKKGKGKF